MRPWPSFVTPRFRRQPSPARSASTGDAPLRAAVASARASAARFAFRSAVSDPFSAGGELGGWEDDGLVDFRRPAAWYRRRWRAPGAGEDSVGVLFGEDAVTLRPDGTRTDVRGAPHLLHAPSNPIGLVGLLDPRFSQAAPSGAGRWRVSVDFTAARAVLGARAIGPGLAHVRGTLAATAQVADGRLEIVAAQTGVWGEPHAWAVVRFAQWGAAVPEALAGLSPGDADHDALRDSLATVLL